MSESYGTNVKHHLATLRGVDVVVPLGKIVWDNAGTIEFRDPLDAPTTKPTVTDLGSGSGPDGTYRYYATWYDENTDQESNPSPISDAVVVTDDEVRITVSGIGTAPDSATHIRLYRNQDGGSTYRRITTITVATSSYDDDATDASIAVNAQLETDNDTLPSLDLIERNGARLFGAKASALYWCKASKPENWPSINAVQVARSNGYDITALRSAGESLIIYKGLGIHVFEYDVNPLADGWVKEIDPSRGALNARCVVDVGADHIVMDTEGIYLLRGLSIIDLSEPISPLLERRNMVQSAWFSGEGDNSRVRFHIALDDDSTINYALELDYRALQASGYNTAVWTLLEFDHDTRDVTRHTFGTKAGSSNGTLGINGLEGLEKPLAMTGDALVWVEDVLTAEGVPSWLECESTVATASNVSSKTRITKADAAPYFQNTTIDQDVTGCYLRFYRDKKWTRAYQIDSVGGNNQLDLAEEVDGDVSDYAGLPFIIGGMHLRFDSPVHDFDDPSSSKFMDTLHLMFEPLPKARGLNLSINLDHRGFSVMGMTRDRDGADSTKNESRQVLTLGGDPETEGGSGTLAIPTDAEAFRSAQFRFDGYLPRAHVVIHRFLVNARGRLRNG
jgi:hypothetical protein